MKKKKHIQTDFIRFMIEKYIDQDEDSSIEQEPDEPQSNSKKLKKLVELDDEVNDEDDELPTDELIDELVNEYKRLKKANESYRIHYRRKR